MNKRIAVMDLGTNTFHLLITEGSIADHVVLEHEHIAVKLGEGGINKGTIQPEAFARGLSTMQQFKKLIDKHQVDHVRAIATSALRNAGNGHDFIQQVKGITGIHIEIIDGDTEAGLIYEGIKASGCLSANNTLIMDIGGGSVEFILGNNNGITWKQSFEIGAARLMDKFHQTDPIPQASIVDLNNYLDDNLEPLFQAAEHLKVNKLIGSSGAFETFTALIEKPKNPNFKLKDVRNYDFDYEYLTKVTDDIISSSHDERATNPAINPVRVDMIVVASLITRFVMRRLDIHDVAMSTYSLKEGVLAQELAN
ncbi:exopolyphosphatase [Mucilaginibacter roseus]|uniref:Exopolyphosphatase n=1 Tax=Mucilaginibacter roseus TaxID=1528868 RepID=A0ABS8TZK7_9SPHI|nr:exopolyphosphatase [Mucilaginibacter roseus]MCD8739437.1 exopolyphosphatase [Mucilaginibacter roseus]